MDDSTFRAYRTNPKFLSSILPLSLELDAILGRIFECDPRKRIGIPELRSLIFECPTFTTRPTTAPPTPYCEPQCIPEVPLSTVPDMFLPLDQCLVAPSVPTLPSSAYPVSAQLSTSSGGSSFSDTGSTFSDTSAASSCSSSSSCTGFEQMPKFSEPIITCTPTQPSTQQTVQFFENYYPMEPFPRPMMAQPFMAAVSVC